MSMPRAAMSVATSTRYLPRLKSSSARVRCALRAVAVNAFGRDLVLEQRRGQTVRARLRARKRDRAKDIIVLE